MDIYKLITSEMDMKSIGSSFYVIYFTVDSTCHNETETAII